jgi:CO/xanthine dehydrogenase Mo-binding subunit
MEPYATTVIWNGKGKLTVYDKTQGVQNVQRYICSVFDLKPGDVRVMSTFVGGAFGSGLRPQYQVVLAVLAARALQRSVRVVLTRQQLYSLGYRPAMIQRIELGAKANGTLDAIIHDAITVTSQFEDFHRNETTWSALLYKSDAAKYTHKLARIDLPTSCDMRGPSATTGVYALESAIDELAVALQIIGGVVWGIGVALHEETLIDHHFGRIMNANIAEYHVPVNADVHDIEVIFVDEPDTMVNPLGIKGLGEIGIVGVPAAIANAIYHATGKRVRDLPITLDKLQR